MVLIPFGFRSTVPPQGADTGREYTCIALDAFLGLFVGMVLSDYSQAIE